MKLRIHILALLVCGVITSAFTQEDYYSHPGFVNLDDIEIPAYSDDVTEVTIGPELLGMIGCFADDHEVLDAEDFQDFIAIHVKNFDIMEKDTEKIRKKIAKIEKKLRSEQWQQLVRHRSRDEITNISIKYDKDRKRSLGLMIISFEPGSEASFVNIVGNINLKKLGQMGVNLDDNTLDSLENVLGKNKGKHNDKHNDKQEHHDHDTEGDEDED